MVSGQLSSLSILDFSLLFHVLICICISVLGSDVIYSEGAVVDLIATLLDLSGTQTTVILAGELRNGIYFRYYLNFKYPGDTFHVIFLSQMQSLSTSYKLLQRISLLAV